MTVLETFRSFLGNQKRVRTQTGETYSIWMDQRHTFPFQRKEAIAMKEKDEHGQPVPEYQGTKLGQFRTFRGAIKALNAKT